MANGIGIIKVLVGNVVAITTDGTQRNLHVGDHVSSHDIITTAANGAIEIEFSDGSILDLGRNSQRLLDDVLNLQNIKQTSLDSDIEEFQQSLLEGADPIKISDATAAGLNNQSSEGGGSVVQIIHEQQFSSPTSGFVTKESRATGTEFSVLRDEDEVVPNIPPIINSEDSSDIFVLEDAPAVNGNIPVLNANGNSLTFELLDAAPEGLRFNSDGSYCSGLMEPHTLITDNQPIKLRCEYDAKKKTKKIYR